MKGSTRAIIKQNNQFAVVYSHACNSAGMTDGNGFSVVVYHQTLRCVLGHITTFFIRFLKVVFGFYFKKERAAVSQKSYVMTIKKSCVGKKRGYQCKSVSGEEERKCSH